MEYGIKLENDIFCNNQFISNCDEMNLTHIGWNKNTKTTECWDKLFNYENIQMISRKITELTKGIFENRDIIVPNDKICHILTQVYKNHRPKTGDIYSRYIIPDKGIRNDIQQIIDETIEIITSDIRINFATENKNSKLNIWVTQYGEGNSHGLQQIPRGFAKIRHKRPMQMMFNMNY